MTTTSTKPASRPLTALRVWPAGHTVRLQQAASRPAITCRVHTTPLQRLEPMNKD